MVQTLEDLGAANAPEVATEPPGEPAPTAIPGGGGTTNSGNGGGGIGLGTLVAVALLGGGGYLLLATVPARSAQPGPTGEGVAAAPVIPEALARQANALLIATDERIRDAGQEVDFAEAEFGPQAVTNLRDAVAAEKSELSAAFTVRQQLDNDIPEDEPARLGLLNEIVARTSRAQEILDAGTDHIRRLRRSGARCAHGARRAPGPDRGHQGPAARGRGNRDSPGELRRQHLGTSQWQPGRGAQGSRRCP